MIIGGIKHREQRFNSRSAGVSSALLFISVGGTCLTVRVFCHFFKFDIVFEGLNCHKPHLNTPIQLQERSRFYFQHVATVWITCAVCHLQACLLPHSSQRHLVI